MRRVRNSHRIGRQVPDQVRLTIAYLRLWKICDVKLSETHKHDSARVFEVIPFDEAKILRELRSMSESKLDWADKPKELRTDLNTVLELSVKKTLNDKETAALEYLRTKFQKLALQHSGDIEIAMGGAAQA
jgi:hypothetical protein